MQLHPGSSTFSPTYNSSPSQIPLYHILLFLSSLIIAYADSDRSGSHPFSLSFKASKAPNGSYIWNSRRLYDYLMEDYKTSLLPVNHSKETIEVHLDLKSFWVEDLVSFSLSGHCFHLV